MTTARETATTAVNEAGAVAGTAKDEAATVATTAAEQARTVAQTATQATSDVVGEAARQARDLVGEARQQVRTQAETQTQRLAENTRSLAQQITSLAQGNAQQGAVTDVAHQLAGKVESLAGYIEGRTPEAIVDDLRRYARQKPGLFLLGAGAFGFLAGRLIKGATAPAPGTTNDVGTGAWTGADTTNPGTATGNPVAGMELAAGTQTVMPRTPVPQFTAPDPYPTGGYTGTPGLADGTSLTGGGDTFAGGEVVSGSGLRTPGIGDGYGNG
jgi:hypothetical protein